MENKPLLKIKDLTVVLDNRKILDGISFEMHQHDVLSVIGPNGSGKSTLLKTIIGIEKPAEGTIEISRNTKIGYLPQRFGVDKYLPMTVGEFLNLKPGIKQREIKETLSQLSLETSFTGKTLSSLSGGQLQKALIAWVIADKPNLLLFDEPTENIDMVSEESIYMLLHELQKTLKMAMIIVSHDLSVVYKYSNNVACINSKMMCYGQPKEILTPETLQDLYGGHSSFFLHKHGEDNIGI